MHKEECWRRPLGCAPGGDFGEDAGMCTRRGAWEGLGGVPQEESLGRTVGMLSRTGIWKGLLGCAPRRGGWDVCIVELPALGRKSCKQDHVLQRFALPLSGVWGGEEYFICTTGSKCSLLNHYWRLFVGSIRFNFSHGVGVAEEGSQQQREVLGCFASHPLLLFY